MIIVESQVLAYKIRKVFEVEIVCFLKGVCIFFLCLLGTYALLKTGYKRVYFDASDWSQYISKTTLFQSKSVIECGSACVAFGGCVLFVRDKESEKFSNS